MEKNDLGPQNDLARHETCATRAAHAGYNLMEILIVVAIIGALSVMGIQYRVRKSYANLKDFKPGTLERVFKDECSPDGRGKAIEKCYGLNTSQCIALFYDFSNACMKYTDLNAVRGAIAEKNSKLFVALTEDYQHCVRYRISTNFLNAPRIPECDELSMLYEERMLVVEKLWE